MPVKLVLHIPCPRKFNFFNWSKLGHWYPISTFRCSGSTIAWTLTLNWIKRIYVLQLHAMRTIWVFCFGPAWQIQLTCSSQKHNTCCSDFPAWQLASTSSQQKARTYSLVLYVATQPRSILLLPCTGQHINLHLNVYWRSWDYNQNKNIPLFSVVPVNIKPRSFSLISGMTYQIGLGY